MIDLDRVTEEEVALLAVHGDKEAYGYLWAKSESTAQRLGLFFQRKYPWVDGADIAQGVLLCFPKIISRYDPEKGTPWKKYCYHCYYRSAQDFLRKLDPLGIKYPQRKHYPAYVSTEQVLDEQAIIDGLKSLDNGKQAKFPDA